MTYSIEADLTAGLPSGWTHRRLKEVADVIPSNVDKHSVEGQATVRLCNYVDTYKNERITASIDFMPATATQAQIERLGLRKGDITITKDSESPWDIAVPSYIAEEIYGLVCGYHLSKISPAAGVMDGGYLSWALRSKPVNIQFALAAQGITRYGLSSSALADGVIPCPPIGVQLAIASYLDGETARIDGLIADKEALVGTLKEMRRSTVAEAISRGVRGKRPMRPSGLSWVNEIPAGWETLSLKRFVRLSGGHTPSTGNPAYWDGSVPWFSPKDMKADELQDSIDHVTELAVSETGLQVIERGTTMIVVRGMILAHTFPVCVAQVKATINQDMKALVPDERVDKCFLPWLLRGASALLLSLTEQSAHGTMALRTERFMGEKLPIPPLDEQIEIVEHLEAERQRIDLLLRQIHQEIDLLRELRSATITDAVLGRIDVREHMKH